MKELINEIELNEILSDFWRWYEGHDHIYILPEQEKKMIEDFKNHLKNKKEF